MKMKSEVYEERKKAINLISKDLDDWSTWKTLKIYKE